MDFQAAHVAVLETLERAVSQNAEIFKGAEEQLKEWEKVPGFYTILQSIFINYEINYNVRLMAILLCKNGIDRFWRKNAPNALSEEEKSNLRRGFLMNFREPMPHLGNQLALLIAKVARYDFPHEWGELIPSLLEAVKNGDPLVQNRSVLILHQVVKTLASKRLAIDQKIFQDLSAHIFSYIYTLWESHTHMCFVKGEENILEAKKHLENALLSLKILEKLVIYGFQKPHTSQMVNEFLKMVFQQVKTMLEIRAAVGRRFTSSDPQYSEAKNFVAVSEKYIYRLGNVLVNLLANRPLSFVEYINPALELGVYYAFTPEGEQLVFEKFLILCFNLMKAIIVCPKLKNKCYKDGNSVAFDWNKKGPSNHSEEEETEKALIKKGQDLRDAFFDDATLSGICRRTITHYFLLTQADLVLWETEPETFAMDEGGESWKYFLRPCVESWFVTVFHRYCSSLAPVLVDLIKTNHNLVPPGDLNAILAKDAVYNAIGLAAFDMYGEINFNDWFMTTLREELNVSDSSYRIIRRRIIWLLGRWANVKFSPRNYPILYSHMIPLLGSQEDMVVRLTTASALKTVVDNFEFNIEQFLEYLQPIFASLFQLLMDVEECETKMRVLSVLYFIVERVGPSIEPYSGNLLQYLPLLWRESENHNMLRCAVVTTLVHLMRALGHIKVNEDVIEFVLSIISYSTDIKNDNHVYLLEDGLELWQAVIENMSSSTPEVMQLFSNMPVLLENNSEYLRSCIKIIKAYVLLAPEEFLRMHGEAVVKGCMDIMSDLKTEGIVLILKLFELFVKVNASSGVTMLKPLLPSIFEQIYKGEGDTPLMTNYLSILSRIILTSKEAFIETVNKLSLNEQKSPEEVFYNIIDSWLSKMILVPQMDRRKLMALALASLLTSQSRFVYDKFSGLLLEIVEVLNDIMRVDVTGEKTDSFFYRGEDEECTSGSETGHFETGHELRKKRLAMNDPIHSIALDAYLKSQLSELQTQVGGDFQKFIDTVDGETLAMARVYVPL